MGVMAPAKPQTTSPAMKRRSGQLDFSNLGPLKTSGTVGFSTFRDKDSQPTGRRKLRKSNGAAGSSAMDADSDDDDDDDDSGEILSKMEDTDTKYDKSKLGPDDAKSTGELADGLNRIRVCYPQPLFSRDHNPHHVSPSSSSVPTPPTQTAPPARASPPAPARQHRPSSSPSSHRRPRASSASGGTSPTTPLPPLGAR